jgi:hypothetical protein
MCNSFTPRQTEYVYYLICTPGCNYSTRKMKIVNLKMWIKMSGLKIGILTFHKCINYGSFWQAYSLAMGLKSYGHHAEILDHHADKVNLAEWKCALQPVLPTPVPASDQPLYREKMDKFFRSFSALPISRKFDIDSPEQMGTYDMVVVGSDEVWNLMHPWYGRYPIFYGEGLGNTRLVSYAASFGNYNAEWGLPNEWAEKLRAFEHISVRDANSQALVKNAIGIEPQLVLDPCLQFLLQPEPRDLANLPTQYIAVYGHNFSPSFVDKIRTHAVRRKIPLISIGYRNDWADEQWLTADPHDFIHFIQRSAAVSTNFFHGCVFSLRNNKPFVCEASGYRNNKLQGLLSKVKGEHHLISAETQPEIVNYRMYEPVDESIHRSIAELRKTSTEYLQQALSWQPQYA